MKNKRIVLNDDDLRLLFSLFSSPTKHEREQVHTADSPHYFANLDLSEEYQLSEEKREFALDAWRAVLYFLRVSGYALVKDDKILDLAFSEEEFV